MAAPRILTPGLEQEPKTERRKHRRGHIVQAVDAIDDPFRLELPTLLVANKSDLENAADKFIPPTARPVSALTGEGVDELADAIVERLLPRRPEPGTAVPISSRLVEHLRQAEQAIRENDESAYRVASHACLG